MKKLLLTLLVILLPIVAKADDSGICGDNVTYTFEESTGTLIISGTGAIKDFMTIADCPWWNYKDNILKLVINPGIEVIGTYSFMNCINLTTIVFSDDIKSIGAYAFSGCFYIKDVNIPNLSVWCGIKFENFQSNPLSYAQNLCVDGKPIYDVVIPDGVTRINKWVFASYKNLKSIKFSDTVSRIDSLVFYKCINLKTIEIPNSVTSIDIDAFSYCTSLTTVKLSENLTSIPDGLFCDCHALSSINIPEGVTSIGINAFNGCNSLESIFLPESIVNIGEYAFYFCNHVKKVTILAKTPPAINSHIFSCWDATLYVPDDVFDTYKSTAPWMYFGTIKTGIADITSLPVEVQSNGGTITVTGADDGTIVEVYTMAGTKLGKAKTSFNTATIHTNMQQGNVVIVKVGGKAIKVAL